MKPTDKPDSVQLHALAGLPNVELRWHSFQLNPDLPAAGVSRQQYLADKFGGPFTLKTAVTRPPEAREVA